MKKGNLLKRLTTLAVLAALVVCMGGCVRPYSTLEEFAVDHPLDDQLTSNMRLKGDGLSATFNMEIKDNTIIGKMVFSKKIFGSDAKLNAVYKSVFDEYFNSSETKHDMSSTITSISSQSGIDASLITVQWELYNPGEDTPFYTKAYTK